MNYNIPAFVVMILGIAVFYVFLETFSLFESILVLGGLEGVAVVLFLYAEIDQRCKALEKRIKKLEKRTDKS